MKKSVIGTLLDSYSTFGRFEVASYYTVCFGNLPSNLNVRMEMTMDRSQAALDAILNQIDWQRFGFEPVFKNWITDDTRHGKPAEDYPFEYLFKSDSARIVIHVTCHIKMSEIEFFYDLSQPETEQWILETSHQLQAKLKGPKKPKFKVLIHQEGSFNTEDVETGNFETINLEELYNDDFLEIDKLIAESMNKTESGMVLLHGDPGTGKTTYIKHLISRHQDKLFIFVQNDFVKDLLKPIFISFLLQHRDAILIIEDAEKVVVSRDNAGDDSVVSTILQLTDGLFSDFLNIKIICTFNTNIERIDKALLRKGRMIAKYKFAPLSTEKTSALARKLGYENISGSLTLADIFGYEQRNFNLPAKRGIGFPQS